ncbi:uncharacterized protein K452DRAFT_282180 [Aplosporella prunicola CBS 121167]|uniref:Uncharacterized protein n=1 Tax=Aplosporella prunicola CBS 121167 TaxID=1176127 RepID=A0A6A6BWV7_9PEZI|nr:uncharacterized protein K452DRAFT_282180 [Aplosporella prunicola CBS 121167]KAF2147201.1 hypothetical protein K452DRAFT_282180 [Aplosporella prunicola CBS 121167]
MTLVCVTLIDAEKRKQTRGCSQQFQILQRQTAHSTIIIKENDRRVSEIINTCQEKEGLSDDVAVLRW